MICSFCHREFDDGLTECPYCHYMVQIEPSTLSREERDSFEGMTIETDGTVSGGGYRERGGEDYSEDRTEGSDMRSEQGSGIHVFRFGSSLLFWVVGLLILLAAVFFLLPAFLLGAVVFSVVVFIIRLFNGF